MNNENCGFSTRAIHGSSVKDGNGALITPIYNTSTFIFDSTAQGAARFALEEPGYIYARLGNPTCAALEETFARLEGGEAALVTVSGMGAITSTIWTCISAGEEIVADNWFARNTAKADVPHFMVSHVVRARMGAFPGSCCGAYEPDEQMIRKYTALENGEQLRELIGEEERA